MQCWPETRLDSALIKVIVLFKAMKDEMKGQSWIAF